MNRYIVTPRTHEVREEREGIDLGSLINNKLSEGEFFFDAPTSADAAMAGRRHNLAVEALESLPEIPIAADIDESFQVVADRIEWKRSDTAGASAALVDLADALSELGFEVWREGLALLVLARRVQGTEGIHAWVSEIGSNR